MFEEKNTIEVIEIKHEINIVGPNLQKSGLPINFNSLGVMWENFTNEMKKSIKNRCDIKCEYAVALNKVPDYIVGVDVTKIEDIGEFASYTIPTGKYIKASFNAKNHDLLVDKKLMDMQKKAKKWAKDNKVNLNKEFTIEVYPQATIEQEYPEMYILIPVL